MKGLLKELRAENQKQLDLLPFEEESLIRDLTLRISAGAIRPLDLELIRRDIIEIALEAEARAESLKGSIGDEEAFCRGVVEACFHTHRGENALRAVERTLLFAALLASLLVVKMYRSGSFKLDVIVFSCLTVFYLGSNLLQIYVEPRTIFASGLKQAVPRALPYAAALIFLLLAFLSPEWSSYELTLNPIILLAATYSAWLLSCCLYVWVYRKDSAAGA